MLVCWAEFSGAASLAVIYPEIDGPYQKVFQTIIDGMQTDAGISLDTYPLKKGESPHAVEKWLESRKPDAVVALGRRGYLYAKSMDLDLPMVVGGTLMTPNGLSGISLVAAPEQFFKRLSMLSPQVKRVYTVYKPENTGWLIDQATQAAARYGMELKAFAVGDEREATQNYINILKQVQEKSDALWLPLDNVVPDTALLPLILKQAWEKQLVVFSNNPSHTRKGVLFSLYPDHRGLGERLAEMALDLKAEKKAEHVVLPLSDVKLAVNLRTASHLGMIYSASQQQAFSLVFPGRR